VRLPSETAPNFDVPIFLLLLGRGQWEGSSCGNLKNVTMFGDAVPPPSSTAVKNLYVFDGTFLIRDLMNALEIGFILSPSDG
jgi:hypothetical protein